MTGMRSLPLGRKSIKQQAVVFAEARRFTRNWMLGGDRSASRPPAFHC